MPVTIVEKRERSADPRSSGVEQRHRHAELLERVGHPVARPHDVPDDARWTPRHVHGDERWRSPSRDEGPVRHVLVRDDLDAFA